MIKFAPTKSQAGGRMSYIYVLSEAIKKYCKEITMLNLNLNRLLSIVLLFCLPLLGFSQTDCSRTCAANGPCGVNEAINGSFEGGALGFVGGGTGVGGWETFGNVFLLSSPDAFCVPFNTEAAPGNGRNFIKMFGTFSGVSVMIGSTVGATEGETFCGSVDMFSPSGPNCALAPFNDNIAAGNPNFGLVQIQFLDAVGEVVCFSESDPFESANANSTWQQFDVVGVVPAGAVSARLLVLFIQPGFDGGAIYYDNAQLARKAELTDAGAPFPSLPLACNDAVNATVTSTCGLDVTVDAFIEGAFDPFLYDLTVFDPSGAELGLNDLSGVVGEGIETFEFRVSNLCGDNFCWGELTVEDKNDPVLVCQGCTDPMVNDPNCIFNCTEEKLFSTLVIEDGIGRFGFDEGLLDDLIPTDREDFVDDFVTDNCGGGGAVADFSDTFSQIGDCSEGVLMTRTWTVTYERATGGFGSQTCVQYYRFDPLEVFDDAGTFIAIEAPHDTVAPGVFVPIIDETTEDMILLPKTIVEIPNCNIGTSPAEIAAFFDNPLTVDRDTDDNGIDPDEFDVDCVIESNEGIWFAYPHYYIDGIRPTGPHAQPIMDGVCNIIVDFMDTPLDACAPGCGGNTKTLRTWTIVDWCNSLSAEYQQVISVFDDLEPRLVLENDQIVASVDPWQCAADVAIPAPKTLDDVCDNDITYYIGFVEGALEVTGNADDGFVLMGAPIGTTQIQYVAEDCCGNRAETLATITVSDRTAPVPVTKANLVVELGSINSTNPNQTDDQGTAKIFAVDVDNNSFDSCTEVEIAIRRSGTDYCIASDTIYGEAVTFCCDDIDRDIDVQLRVCDKNGNCNFLWTTVAVEDKISGAGTCPLDMVLPCNADIWDFDLTGIPTSFGTCMQNEIELDTAQIFDDTEPRNKRASDGGPTLGIYFGVAVPAFDPSCGFGAIRREFDGCTQWFVLEPTAAFDPSTIVWPADQTVVCEQVDSGEPTFLAPECMLVGVDVVREDVTFEEGSCQKILYHWTIVDWCTFDPSNPEGGGIFEWTQVINVIDDVAPEVVGEDGLCFGVDTEECTRKGISLSAVGTDEGDCPSAWLSWEIQVDFNADWEIDCVYETNTSPTLSNGEPNPKFVAKTSSGEAVTIVLDEELDGDKSQHRVEWIVRDGCGNLGTTTTYFTVEDKKAPTPYCLNLGTAVMAPTDQFPQGMVELWAVDFDVQSFDNCLDQDGLIFTFTDVAPPPRCDEEYDREVWYDTSFWFFDSSETVNVDPADDDGADCPENGFGAYEDGGFDEDTGVFTEFMDEVHRFVPSRRSTGAVFTSDQVDATGFLQIPIYVWDDCGNRDFCLVNLRIINNDGGAGRVAGEFRTEDDRMVENVSTQLMSAQPGMPLTTTTLSDGSYAFENILEDADYQISGEKNDDYGNGISTVDLIIMQRHILGIERLETPYQMISADINSDKKINGQDLVELRKLILGTYTELPQNDSWKFVRADQELTISNPWIFEEQIEVVSMTSEVVDLDFIAAKIGDVDGTARVDAASGVVSTGKVTGFIYDDRPVLAGEEVEIVLSSTEDLYGYQFTMDMSAMSLVNVEGNGLTQSNVAVLGDKMTMSHGSVESMTGDLVTITLKSNKAGQLSDLIGMTSDVTAAEAYVGEGLEVQELRMIERSATDFALGQNEPNPFTTQTQISYTLPEAGQATLTMYDVTGKVLEVKQLRGEKGANTVTVQSERLTSGIVYYKLESGEYTATRHMIVIE